MTLGANLDPGEEPKWLGWVSLIVEDTAMLMTDRRLMWASVKPPGHWQALDLITVAEHGIILPRQWMLTVGATSNGVYKSWEFRPREPGTFDDLPWPEGAVPFIEKWLETSDEFAQSMRPSRLIRRLFGRSRQPE